MAITLGDFADGTARRRPAGQGLSPRRGWLRSAARPSIGEPYQAAAAPAGPQGTGETGGPEFTEIPAAHPADGARGQAQATQEQPPQDERPQGRHCPAGIDPRLLRKTFTQLEPQSDSAMAYFYGSLFLRHPEFRAMFPLAMDGQRRRLFDGLARCVWGAGQDQALTEYLEDLARDHRKFGVAGRHYRPFCDALLASLRDCRLGWDEDTLAAWEALLSHIATVMAGTADAAAAEPAWWLGEVVRHERRGPGVAVLTIRPDGAEPLRHRPGQYITVQVPRWPRVWRCYSVASAPRADGTLDLHVRAVPGGRVSTLLVEQAGPGDSLVLGPARGSMTLAAARGAGSILCVAGGTGLAPLKALAEEIAAAGAGAPPVRLVVGARHHDDLYDLPDLERLAAACPSLTVIPVVAPPAAAARGGLPAAAAAQLTPDTGDVFVSGPDTMVRATTRRLAAQAPAARIHSDTAGSWPSERRQHHRDRATEEAGDGCHRLRPGARPAVSAGEACPVRAS